MLRSVKIGSRVVGVYFGAPFVGTVSAVEICDGKGPKLEVNLYVDLDQAIPSPSGVMRPSLFLSRVDVRVGFGSFFTVSLLEGQKEAA